MSDIFVDTEWLATHLHQPGTIILDCSWHLPETGRNARDDFRVGHIPGARFFDLNEASDPDSPYANMLPTPDRFASYVGRLGIANDSHVVVYDAGYVSARVWWMFRHFGHDTVQILNGGWRKWKAEARPIETGDGLTLPTRRFVPAPRQGMVADWHDVLANINSNAAELVDARTAERFTGAMPSGYPGVPGGHIPGAKNLPWSKLQDQKTDFRFVTAELAKHLFQQSGVDLDKPVIASCGSGVTAAIIGLMLEQMGKRDWRLYDGSWHEWGQRPDLPKASG